MKLKISFLVALLLFCNCSIASDPTLTETLDWLKKTIPQYTVEDRSDDFNRFFKEDTECFPATSPSFWELSYDEENLCNLTVMLKDMRKYEFTLIDAVKVFTKQRGEYIKLVIRTVKDGVRVKRIIHWNNSPEFIPEVSRTNIVVVDFPLHAKRMAIQVTQALEHAVSLCAVKKVLQHRQFRHTYKYYKSWVLLTLYPTFTRLDTKE